MVDLVKAFFSRDLTDGEIRQLEQELESSDDACLRLAQLAKKAYLQTGLPTPKAPGGGGAIPGGGIGLIHHLPLWFAVGVAVTGLTALIYWRGHSTFADLSPRMETVAPAIPKTNLQPISKPRVIAPPVTVPVIPPSTFRETPVLPQAQGFVEPMVYVPGKKYGGLSVVVQQAQDDLVTVRVVDGVNIEARILFAGVLSKGTWTFTWDGKLSAGKKAEPGSYWVEVQSDKTVLRKEIRIQQFKKRSL